MLGQYSQTKWVFTNSDSNHGRRVLHALNLEGIFEGIIDVRDIAPYCKPMPEAFSIALRKAGQLEPQSCALIDDTLQISIQPMIFGFFTVLVGADEGDNGCSGYVSSLASLPNVLPVNAKKVRFSQ